MEFVPFPKIPRLSREVVLTEKIDGTNASISIRDAGECSFVFGADIQVVVDGRPAYIRAASRTRWLQTGDDNYGFWSWVHTHAHELAQLGIGTHFGEWWGSGIQRGYGLPKGEKRFSLFNTSRWVSRHTLPTDMAGCSLLSGQNFAPDCCHVVPELARGQMNTADIDHALRTMKVYGSAAAPGFMNPEGIIIYHTAGNLYFKKTIEKDGEWKGKAAA